MRKQSLTHEDFLALRARAAALPRAVLDRRIDEAVGAIQRAARGHVAAYAWSGGKDSQALRFLAELADVPECVLGMCDLEYPAFLRWITDHMPPRLEVVNTGLDLDWLARHEDWLFPRDARTAAKWFHAIQHRAQDTYCARRGIDVLFVGRRRDDGNFLGRGARYVKHGVALVAPLADWTHEEIFALLDRFAIPLPPVYGWPRGFRTGTHAWPARQWCGDVMTGWREVHTIDPEIPRWAATRLPSARRFLAAA